MLRFCFIYHFIEIGGIPLFLTKKTSKLLAKFLLLLMFISNPACIVAVHAATSTENTALIQDPSSTTFTVDKSATGAVITDDNRIGNENLTEQQKALNFSNHLLNYYLNNGKGHGPQWLKTTDIQFLFTEDHKPIYAVESLQPFGGIKDNGSFWFWQGRYAHESASSSTANLGIGWRKLSADKSSMIGFNTFYDYGFQYNLARIGVGAEYFNKQAEYRANFYHPVSGDRQTGVSYLDTGILTSYIRAVEGGDFEAGTSFTHMPWLKLYASAYYWDNKYHDDERGYRLRSTLQLTPRVNMELGYYNSNLNHSFYGKVNYQLALDSMSTLFGSNQKQKNNADDLSAKLLQKVVRENDIKTETYIKMLFYKGNIKTTVTNSTNGTALAGAIVQAYQNGSAVGNPVTTDSSGQALMSGLDAGTYTINATYANYSGSSQLVTVTKDQTSAATVSLAVPSGSATITVVNAQSQAVSGATVVATLKSTTVAAAERSVMDRILGVKIAYAGTASYSFTATTDANGVATFTNLPPGSYTFTCTENGLTMQSEDVSVTAGSASTCTLLVSNSGGNIIAVIKSTSGYLLSGATVNVLSGSTVIASGLSDSNGTVLFGGLTAGTYTLSASLNTFVTNNVSATVTDRSVTRNNIVLSAQASGTAQITVTDGTHTLSGVAVSAAASGMTYTGTTNTAGVAAIDLPAGTYTLSASMSGYNTSTVNSVAIKSGSTTSETMALSGAGSTSITVNDGTTAISGAAVSTTINGTIYSGTTNSSGVTTISGIPTGTYSFTASAAGYTSSTGNILVTTTGGSGTITLAAVPEVAPTTNTSTYAVTLPTNLTGGTVSAVSGSSSPVAYGGSYTFVVTPSAGYSINTVTVNGSAVTLNGSNQYTITNITAAQNVVVTFRNITTYAVNLPTGLTGGTVTAVSPSASPVIYGGSYTFVVTPSAGYSIDTVTVNGSAVTLDGSNQYTITNITATQNVVVTFRNITTYAVALPASQAGGTVSAVGTSVSPVPYHGSYTFQVNPTSGYLVDNVTVNGQAITLTSNRQYTIQNINTPQVVQVTFSRPVQLTITFPDYTIHGVTITTYSQNDGATLTFSSPMQLGDLIVTLQQGEHISQEIKIDDGMELSTTTLTGIHTAFASPN